MQLGTAIWKPSTLVCAHFLFTNLLHYRRVVLRTTHFEIVFWIHHFVYYSFIVHIYDYMLWTEFDDLEWMTIENELNYLINSFFLCSVLAVAYGRIVFLLFGLCCSRSRSCLFFFALFLAKDVSVSVNIYTHIHTAINDNWNYKITW